MRAARVRSNKKPRLRGASLEMYRTGVGACDTPSDVIDSGSSQFPTSASYRLPCSPRFTGPVPATRMLTEGHARPRLPSVLVNGHLGVWRVVVFFGGVPASVPVAHDRGGRIHRGKGQDARSKSRAEQCFSQRRHFALRFCRQHDPGISRSWISIPNAGEGSNRRRDAVKWRGFQLRARKIVRGLNEGLTQEERTRSLRRVPHSRRAQRPAQ